MSSEFRRTRSHFADRDPMLQLSLGALSLAERLNALLQQFSDAEPGVVEPAGPPELIFAVLGLIALKNRVLGVLENAATEPESELGSGGQVPNVGSWLGESLLR